MSTAEVRPSDFGLSPLDERPHLRLVETQPAPHEQMRASADVILERYAMDHRFETIAALMAEQGIFVHEFLSGDHRFGLSVHFNPSGREDAPDKVEAGLYPDENDKLESIGAGYFNDSGIWTGFEATAGDGQEPPLRVVIALSAVEGWLQI